MSTAMSPTELLAQLPAPTPPPAPTPRFDGEALAVPLSALPSAGADAVRALYLELEPVEGPVVKGAHVFTLPGYRAAREGIEALAGAALEAPARRAVDAITGLRFRALDYELPRWGNARITQALHLRVLFLAAQERRLLRSAFSGLDDAKRAEDRASGPQVAADLAAQWGRGTTDADPHGLTLEVEGSVDGPVAGSLAELTALQRAVQAMLGGLHARAPEATLTLRIDRVEGALRIAGALTKAAAAADPAASEQARELVAQAFGLEGPAAAEAARLVGELELEGGVVAWVSWPPLP